MEPFDPTNHQFESDPGDKEKCLHCGCVRGAHTQPGSEQPNTETAVATCPSCAMTPEVQSPPPQNIEVTAENPDEMAHAQNALIAWAESKVSEVRAEHHEALESYEIAVKHKWRSEPLKRAADKALKRLTFYQKILAALKAGFVIVPNFPVTAFAIRTDKRKPLKMVTVDTHVPEKEHQPDVLPVGEGEYQNPFPVTCHHIAKKGDPQGADWTAKQDKYRSWAEAWKDLVFPLSMVKPRIMEAVNRAMALKIFDDLCLFERGTGDPIIVARIYNPTRAIYAPERYSHVTVMVAWHLNTRDL